MKCFVHLAAGIGSVLGGTVVSIYGFKGVFIVMAALAFLAASYIAALKKEVLG